MAVVGIPVPCKPKSQECEEFTGSLLGQAGGGEARMWGRKRLRGVSESEVAIPSVDRNWTAVARADEEHGLGTTLGLCGYMLGFICGMSCVRTKQMWLEQRRDGGNLIQRGIGK